MRTTIVTAIYYGEPGFPFYLHEYLARYERYKYSLLQLSKMGTPIICYTNKKNKEDLDRLLIEHEVENVQIIEKELYEYEYSKKLLEVKKTNTIEFYHEVDYAKLEIIEKHSKDTDYIYWIDAGLSYWSLWPNKYNPNVIDGMSHTITNYEFSEVFNGNFIPNINRFVGDKLLQIRNTQLWYLGGEVNKYLDKKYLYKWFSIGGIIGGNVKHLPTFLDSFKIYADMVTNQNFILNHEAIMSVIGQEHENIFKTFTFDTWYHEDSGVDLKNEISFCNFIEEIK